MMEHIFNDENEPFWRSAKQVELGVIPPRVFDRFLRTRFTRTSRTVDDATVEALLEITHAHPYGTQELAYALWEVTAPGTTATTVELDEALRRVLRSEHSHFVRIWEQAARAQRVVLEAIADDPGQPAFSAAYRQRRGLPGPSTVQKALAALVDDELIERRADGYRIAEPFLTEWIVRNGA